MLPVKERTMQHFQETKRIVWNLAGTNDANAACKCKEKCCVSKEPHALIGTSQVQKILMKPVKAKRNAAFPRNRMHGLEPRRS